MRTVVSTIGTPFYGTSKHLVDLIQPTLNNCVMRLTNSTSFVHEAKTWYIAEDEVQVSYDVVALYPSIPIRKAIDAITEIIRDAFDAIKTKSNLTLNDIRKVL